MLVKDYVRLFTRPLTIVLFLSQETVKIILYILYYVDRFIKITEFCNLTLERSTEIMLPIEIFILFFVLVPLLSIFN